jgi:deoxyribodipyrimidine photo-lyase
MTIALVWFRRDLRLEDNPAFIKACNDHEYVIPIYILDESTDILGEAQKWWLHNSLESLSKSLKKQGLDLILKKGDPLEIILKIIDNHSIDSIFWNRCYEPLSIKRDINIKSIISANGILVKTINASLLTEPSEIKTQKGDYFKVYTYFWKECLKKIKCPEELKIASYPKMIHIESDNLNDWKLLPKNPNWALEFPKYWNPGEKGAKEKFQYFITNFIQNYKDGRNILSEDLTSRLSPHIHFGEISIWTIWRNAMEAKLDNNSNIDIFLSQIGWREFSYHLLYHVPDTSNQNFKKEFDNFPWSQDEKTLILWKKGMTGFPIIDAGMRELWHSGYMNNRVRMIVASFLTKNLLIDWRLGAQHFLETLLDADLAINSMNWQWVAGSGVDAAPYFRIFNPVIQSKKFDPEGIYIKKWVPELKNIESQYIHEPWSFKSILIELEGIYPKPIINYSETRLSALRSYKSIKQ